MTLDYLLDAAYELQKKRMELNNSDVEIELLGFQFKFLLDIQEKIEESLKLHKTNTDLFISELIDICCQLHKKRTELCKSGIENELLDFEFYFLESIQEKIEISIMYLIGIYQRYMEPTLNVGVMLFEDWIGKYLDGLSSKATLISNLKNWENHRG